LFDWSSWLLLAAITGIGIAVARFAYRRMAKPGSRPLGSD
jgi:hypothetical protein